LHFVLSVIFKKKIGREFNVFNFTTDWMFLTFSVSFLSFHAAKSQSLRPTSAVAAATTNLFFRLKFFHI